MHFKVTRSKVQLSGHFACRILTLFLFEVFPILHCLHFWNHKKRIKAFYILCITRIRGQFWPWRFLFGMNFSLLCQGNTVYFPLINPCEMLVLISIHNWLQTENYREKLDRLKDTHTDIQSHLDDISIRVQSFMLRGEFRKKNQMI